MKKKTTKKLRLAWAYDTNNGIIKRIPADTWDSANWGDYTHHDYEGPFRTYKAAQREAIARYDFDRRRAESNLRNARRPDPKKLITKLQVK